LAGSASLIFWGEALSARSVWRLWRSKSFRNCYPARQAGLCRAYALWSGAHNFPSDARLTGVPELVEGLTVELNDVAIWIENVNLGVPGDRVRADLDVFQV
jgi:hypothetical protein